MAISESGTRIKIKKILYLTDFSQPSEAALPFVLSTARNYGAFINALHILTPAALAYATPKLREAAIANDEELAQAEMQKVDSQLAGLPHETSVEWGTTVWSSVQKAIQQSRPELIVLGTHGRTGAQKMLLGSVAEEIFRRSPVPVLTIGPAVYRGTHGDGRFRAVLFATDFGPESEDAAHYAMSLAEENQARLILLHVINGPKYGNGNSRIMSAAEVMHQLHEIVPAEAELWCRPEPVVEYGDPAKMVLHAAKNRGADLIVLGVHGGANWRGPVSHLERAIAHKVVARSPCPVLTARS